MIAGLVASVLWAVLCAWLFLGVASVVRQLTTEGHMVWARADEAIPGLRRNPGIDTSAMRFLMSLIGFVRTRLRRGSPVMQRWVNETDAELTAAGLQTAWDPVIAVAYRLLGALVTAASGMLLVLVVGLWAPVLALMLMMALYGFAVPYVFQQTFRNKARARVAAIERQMPYALEFLAMAMQANAMIHQALAEYVRSASPSDPVAWEFRLVLRDQSLGLGSRAAFSNFAKRVDSPAVRLFVAAVEHGIEKGQSMTKVLSEQAQAARVSRYQAAEALGKNAAIEAIVPMMLCLVSCMLGLVVPMLAKFSLTGV
jgi:hypothetical protein